MNKTPLDDEAQKRYLFLTDDYARRLITRAHIIALKREGTSIQSGDVSSAHNHLERQSTLWQVLIAAAGAIFGVGLSGLIQSLSDGRLPNAIAFFLVLIIGALAFAALLRKT
ncbi:MAG: hypothetical protein KDD70_17955 [Bdellovibrionales bacterium]|nr:hypothetical protein [Bdellovibrionales bacterium]